MTSVRKTMTNMMFVRSEQIRNIRDKSAMHKRKNPNPALYGADTRPCAVVVASGL